MGRECLMLLQVIKETLVFSTILQKHGISFLEYFRYIAQYYTKLHRL